MKGICFIEPLFNAIIERRKTETRRIAKITHTIPDFNGSFKLYNKTKLVKPRFQVGETVYLKEPYCIQDITETYVASERIAYLYGIDKEYSKNIDWQNKLFMPKKYARHFIEITGVKAERLQDISDEDCLEEGIYNSQYDNRYWLNGLIYKYKLDGVWEDVKYMYNTPRKAYADLIDKINGKGTWESNPYVWVYDFKLLNRYNYGNYKQ